MIAGSQWWQLRCLDPVVTGTINTRRQSSRPYDKPSDNDAECFCGVDDHLTIQITERNGAAMFYDDSQGSSGV